MDLMNSPRAAFAPRVTVLLLAVTGVGAGQTLATATPPPPATAPSTPPAPVASASRLLVEVRDGSGRVALSLDPATMTTTAAPPPEPGLVAPNGQLVAEVVREEEGRISVITVAPRTPTDGSRGAAKRVVVTVDAVDDLHWMPDSSGFYYVRTRGENPQVRRVVLAGQSDEEITDAVAPCAMPRVAPDGTTAFVILRDARPETLVHDMYVGSVGAMQHAVAMTTITALAWAADGTNVLYATPTSVVECARRGKLIREWKLAELDSSLAGHRVTALAPSPDGLRLAALVEPHGPGATGERRLILLTLESSAVAMPKLPGQPVSIRWK